MGKSQLLLGAIIPLLALGNLLLSNLESLPDSELIKLLDSVPDLLIFWLLYRQPDPKRYQIIEAKLDKILGAVDRRRPKADDMLQ